MFGLTKQKIKDSEFKSKEEFAQIIMKTMFEFDKYTIEGFFKKTL